MVACETQAGRISPEAEKYRKQLKLVQVESYYHIEPQTKITYPLIRGGLINLGSRTLMVVELTMKFRDNLSHVIHQEQVYPVFVSSFSSDSTSQYLGPGQKVHFAFKAPACPKSWQPGQVDIEITKIVFR